MRAIEAMPAAARRHLHYGAQSRMSASSASRSRQPGAHWVANALGVLACGRGGGRAISRWRGWRCAELGGLAGRGARLHGAAVEDGEPRW